MSRIDYLDPADPIVAALLCGTLFWICFIIYVVYSGDDKQ